MRLNLITLTLLAVLRGAAAQQQSEVEIGRAYYTEGEFKKAAAHFELAITMEAKNAECYYWAGMSYQRMADIALPFGGRYNGKARVYLTKAMELAPDRADYRNELFYFLLDPAGSSRSGVRQAAGILRTMSQSDPDYDDLRRTFEGDNKANNSADARLGRLFLAVPQAAYRIAVSPVPALSRKHSEETAKVARRISSKQ